jgi:anti-sigma regulatory factor (Ser/Thr protein kinase)
MVTAHSDELAYPERAQGITSLTLAAAPAAIGISRQLVRLALTRWGLGPLAEDAELVVSELATNAVQATGISAADDVHDQRRAAAVIQVRVLLYQASVVIEVGDGDPGSPVRHGAASDEEGGRGLMIVTALCKEWDYFHTANGGKVVWAELTVPAELLTPAGLPRRVHGQVPAAGPGGGLIRDPALLCRLHQALRNL